MNSAPSPAMRPENSSARRSGIHVGSLWISVDASVVFVKGVASPPAADTRNNVLTRLRE